MKKKICFILSISITTAYSLLPPLEQNIKEMRAILQDEALKQLISSSEIITDFLRKDKYYLIITNKKVLRVDVRYISPKEKFVGPVKYHLKFSELTEKKDF